MGGRQARRLCPHAIVVRPRMSAYSEASKAVFEVFDDTTPLVEGLSIDEAFLDVGGLGRISGTPTEIAVRLRRDVAERVGLPITVGVARTKFLAKVASGVAKPDGLLVVPPDGELAFLHPLPVERLWGVGRVTAGKLHGRGITTVGEVAELPEEALVSMLGRRVGPAPPRARPQPRPPAGAGRPAPRLDRVAARARPFAEVLRTTSTPSSSGWSTASRAGMRAAGRVGRTVVLRLRFDDFSRATRSHTLPRATAHTQTILATVRGLLAAAMPLIERRGLTLVGIAVANLDDDGAVQLALPFDRSQRRRARRRARRGARAVRLGGRHPGGAARPRPAAVDAAAPRQLKAIDPRASLAEWSPPIRTTRTSVTRRASCRSARATGSS